MTASPADGQPVTPAAKKKKPAPAPVWSGNPDGRGGLVPVGDLRQDPENANDHSDPRSIQAVMASLMEYGQQKPTVHDADGVMVAGNGTLDAAIRLGWSHLWSVQTQLEGHQRDGYAIADNESARLATAHPERTAALLQRIRDNGGNVEATGYDTARMEALLESIKRASDGEASANAPPPDMPDGPLDIGLATVHGGDCVAWMNEQAADSLDAIVCDPPYELGFMGKSWDGTGVAYDPATWRTALRVLKPGGHLVAFGGTRTYHRMVVGIEDAGFEIRDQLAWLYGQGFPKSLDVSKAIDKAAGAERLPTGERNPNVERSHRSKSVNYAVNRGSADVTAPATDAARAWDGWGTALKPAHEPIVLARKPLDGTVADNVQKWGTGALNIDGCRVGADGGTAGAGRGSGNDGMGRWPANVALDPEAGDMLDQQSGVGKDGVAVNRNRSGKRPQRVAGVPENIGSTEDVGYGGAGGASRFFYCAKPSTRERDAGCDAGVGALRDAGRGRQGGNTHPTVKPVALMRWLVRLVTPPGGTVLDPFAGSGTTGVACLLEGVPVILIEKEAPHVAIIEGRLSACVADPASECAVPTETGDA